MKTLISIIVLELFVVTGVLSIPKASVSGVEVVQSPRVDKEKCTADYICYERIDLAYANYFEDVELGITDFEGAVTNYMSKELQKMVYEFLDNLMYCKLPTLDLFTGVSSADCSNEYKGGGDDWSALFLASLNWKSEKIYQAALEKRVIKVPYPYQVTSFYNNKRYERRSGQVEVIMIFENGDWFVDDVIYPNKQTLRETLKAILKTRR